MAFSSVGTASTGSLPFRVRPGACWFQPFGAGTHTVLAERATLATLRAWACQSAPVECIGLLGGRVFRDGAGSYTLVTGSALAIGVRAHTASVLATPEVTLRTRRTLESVQPTCDLTGWFHSHPGLGVFYSGADRETQATYTSPWSVGIVVDPTIEGIEAFGVFLGPTSERQWPASAAGAGIEPGLGIEQTEGRLTGSSS